MKAKTVKDQASHLRDIAAIFDLITVRAKKVAEEPCNGVGAVTRIEESARQIDQIIGVIAEMSLQTNLMAFNASPQAARADDPAKGLALVTPEVCALVRIAPSARPAAGRRS